MRELYDWERQQASRLVREVRAALRTGDRKTRLRRQRELNRFGIYVSQQSGEVYRLSEPQEETA